MGTDAAFKRLDGLRVWGGRKAYELGVGGYSNGRAAIVAKGVEIGVHGEEPRTAEIDAILTVNLPHVELGERTVLVRWNAEPGAVSFASYPESPWRALFECGVVFDSGQRWDAGEVSDYAAGWSLATCMARGHKGRHTALVVDCEECMAEVRAKFSAKLDARLARDAQRRYEALAKEKR